MASGPRCTSEPSDARTIRSSKRSVGSPPSSADASTSEPNSSSTRLARSRSRIAPSNLAISSGSAGGADDSVASLSFITRSWLTSRKGSACGSLDINALSQTGHSRK
eukprot:3364604-Prymnesium_polylepis.2